MGWAVGSRNDRHIGYGVPATCDHPVCVVLIDRGLSYACGGLYDDDVSCDLFFCGSHLVFDNEHEVWLCERCVNGESPFEPSPDVAEWVTHVLSDESWAAFRETEPEWTARYRERAADIAVKEK